MSDFHLIPARRIETEFTDLNSRFITDIGPAFSVDEAQAFIKHIKSKFSDASHHVSAYLIGHNQSTIAHCSDDGEPAGTAGKPALAVLQGSGLGDVVLVVTRYYGGTKLGTGGLVRAYGDSVRLALEQLPKARKVATTVLMFVLPYTHYERVQILTVGHQGKIVDENFAADITLSIRLPDDQVSAFQERLIALTQGKIEFLTIERRQNTILPI